LGLIFSDSNKILNLLDKSKIPNFKFFYYCSNFYQNTLISAKSSISFFSNSFPDTFISGQANHSLVTFTNNEDVSSSGSERVTGRVLDVNDIKSTRMSISGGDNTDSAQISSADDHREVTGIEFDPVLDSAGSKIDFDSVTRFAFWVGVSDGSTVVGDQEWDVVLAQHNLLDLTEFVRGFFSRNSVDLISTFGVINQSKVFVGFFNRNDIHETNGELGISSDLTIDSDSSRHHDLLDFLTVQSVLQSVSDENSQRHGFSKLVGTRSGSEGVDTGGFGQHPMVGSREGFEMFFGTFSSHFFY